MSESLSPSVEVLLEHAGWIKKLAERLVRDPQAAEDIAQDALIAAAGRGPRQPGALRAWLAAIVANAARARSRADVRRSHRERSAARTEALPSAHDVVERAELQRRLVEAVLCLDEPYRTVILLRFYEEREPRDIARMLGQPDATVRTHLARGLARLRARLDREHGGDRGAWAALILPAGATGGTVTTSFAGALLVNTPVKIALVAASMVAVFLLVTRTAGSDATPEAPAITRAADVTPAPTSEAPAFATELRSETRTEAAATPGAAPAHTPPAAPAAPVVLRGRVLDERGTSRAEVHVALLLSDDGKMTQRATSTTSGEFEMPHPRQGGRIVADDPALVTLFAGIVESTSTSGPVVVVAPSAVLQGSVVDASGAPLEGATVRVECPEEMRTRIPHNLDFSQAQQWSTASDARGAWTFAAVPRVEAARLTCVLEGYAPFGMPLFDALGAPFVITLVKPGVREDVVRGRVVDAGGAPVKGAHVALGIETTKSDENGAFAMRTADPKGHNANFKIEPTKLVATLKGFMPGEATASMVDGKPEWPQHVTLRLGEAALTISGIVKDHLGRERAGILVYVADPSFFGEVNGKPMQLENVIAGTTGKSWSFVKTDEKGAFTITGLCARAYTVRAHEPETLLRVDAEDVRAGTTNLVLAMPKDALYPKVAGYVKTHDGQPVADAKIFPMCDAFQARMNGQIIGTSHDALDGTTTDEKGYFEMLDVPKSLVYLRVEREDVLPLEYCRYVPGDSRFVDTPRELPKDKIESLDIRVDRRAHVQVELADATFADEFVLLDEKDKALEVSIFIGTGRREGRRAPIVDGKSYVTAGTDRAKTLVLYKAQVEVGRRGIKLAPGETTTIRW